LLKLKIGDFAKMKKESRNAYWSELNKKAYPIEVGLKKEVSNSDIDQWLRGILGG